MRAVQTVTGDPRTYFFSLPFPLFQINLRLILVSGKTKEFLFSPSESAGEIAKIVFEQWPEGEALTQMFFACMSTNCV
jgi:Ubiquitin-2 like Rad60 SUMO-like